jgi:hypothetical protein
MWRCRRAGKLDVPDILLPFCAFDIRLAMAGQHADLVLRSRAAAKLQNHKTALCCRWHPDAA